MSDEELKIMVFKSIMNQRDREREGLEVNPFLVLSSLTPLRSRSCYCW
jgi:hypothetical protein